jgi:DNA-directed RNA polymerase specialized sigma24 family protein
MGQEAAALDRLLTPWIETEDEEEAEQRLAQLITTEIEPVVKGVIRFKLRFGGGAPEADDLTQEALMEVLGELHKCRKDPTCHPVGDVRGLAATITYRTCYRWLRRQSPHRNALRNRVQYVLTRKPRLALWPTVLPTAVNDVVKRLLGGLAEWRGRNDCASAGRLQQLRNDGSLHGWAGRVSTGGVAGFSEFLEALFTSVNFPVELDELVQVTAELLQVRDEPVASTTAREVPELVSPDDVAWQVEKRIFLQRLWEELQQLPLPQRTALLLNLRDASGNGCIALFPVVGIATMRQMAAALEMPLEQFAALWNQLPLDDAGIAGLLNLTRQQVINLRKAARERLARRLRGFF